MASLHQTFIRLITAFTLGILCASSATAQNTGGIFPPTVNEGHKSLQYRVTLDPDNAEGKTGVAQRLHYQQAINGDFMWRVVGQVKKTDSSDFDFDFIQAELFWQITNDAAPLQSGLRFDARYRGDDRPEQFGLNWTNQFSLGDGWSARALVLSAIQTGENSRGGLFLQTRSNLYRKTSGGQTIGMEFYTNYGNSKSLGSFKSQGHTIGPFVSTPLTADISLYGGVQFGLSDAAAETELRLWITKNY